LQSLPFTVANVERSLSRCQLIVAFLFAVAVVGINHYAVLMLKLPLLQFNNSVALAAG